MLYVLPNGTTFGIWRYKVIADVSDVTTVYKLQVDLLGRLANGKIVDTTKRILLALDESKDMIGKLKSARNEDFESISITNLWKLLEQRGIISGGKIVDYNGIEIK